MARHNGAPNAGGARARALSDEDPIAEVSGVWAAFGDRGPEPTGTLITWARDAFARGSYPYPEVARRYFETTHGARPSAKDTPGL